MVMGCSVRVMSECGFVRELLLGVGGFECFWVRGRYFVGCVGVFFAFKFACCRGSGGVWFGSFWWVVFCIVVCFGEVVELGGCGGRGLSWGC